VALVIGNAAYQHVPKLTNPANDAKLMAETLRGLGFSIVGGGAQIDVDKATLDRSVENFGNELAGADAALFYYAGHGVQVRDANYLVPVTANPVKEADVDFQMLNANLVLRQMEGSGTRLNVVILDACRNNPFAGRSLRAATGGLAQMQAPEGTVISYATQPGNVAQDGKDGNSPFTSSLAQTIKQPGHDVIEAFNEVGLAVKRSTGGNQQPWLSISPIDGKFYFAGAAPGPAKSEGAGSDERALELSFWDTVRTSNSSAVVQTYLDRYPDGVFAALGRARVQELKDKADAVMKQQLANARNVIVPRTTQKPSVSCIQITEPIEELICADAELAEWDGRLGVAFKRKLDKVTDKAAFRKEEREWIVLRDHKCAVPPKGKWTAEDLAPAKSCVLAVTKDRVRILESN
jgi:uncharacterized protein YecT (DUF1311 family)